MTRTIAQRLQRLEDRRPELPLLVLFQVDRQPGKGWCTRSPYSPVDAGARPVVYGDEDLTTLAQRHRLLLVEYITEWR